MPGYWPVFSRLSPAPKSLVRKLVACRMKRGCKPIRRGLSVLPLALPPAALLDLQTRTLRTHRYGPAIGEHGKMLPFDFLVHGQLGNPGQDTTMEAIVLGR